MARVLREPFRILFTAGWVATLVGVGMWPLYHWGVLGRFSGVMHARFQVEGFLGCFVAGFLLTAAPRILEVRPISKAELATLLGLFLGCVGAHLLERPLWGDAFFLGALLFLIVFAARRFPDRKDLPPPFFVLVPIGFLHAVTGAGLLVWLESGHGTLELLEPAKDLLDIGWPLCLVLGIGSFLGPKFFGFIDGMPTAGSPKPTPEWKRSALLYLAAGLAVYASFGIELWGWPRTGQTLRAAIATAILIGRAQIFRRIPAPGLLPQAMRLSMILMLAGLWLLPLFPAHRVQVLHVLFIGGFGLITFVVSARVTLGHSGFEHLFRTRLAFAAVIAMLLAAALVVRAAADAHPESYFAIVSTAALLWLAAAGLWAYHILPKLFFPRPEED